MSLPSPHVLRAVIERYARLVGRHRGNFGTRPLVLPNAAYFPDTFTEDERSVALLTLRMQELAGLDDIPIEVRVLPHGLDGASEGGCGTGACSVAQPAGGGEPRLLDRGDSWLLQVPEREIGHPVVLTTNLARSLAFVFLAESKSESEVLDPPLDVTIDLTAVALGLGALMLSGSYIYAKSCGGPQVARCTQLSPGELSVVVALFASLGGHDLGPALSLLPATQREALREARALVRGNRRLVEQLMKDPSEVARGRFELGEPRGALLDALLRRFGRRPKATEAPSIGLDLTDLESLVLEMPPASSVKRGPSSRPPSGIARRPSPDEGEALPADQAAS